MTATAGVGGQPVRHHDTLDVDRQQQQRRGQLAVAQLPVEPAQRQHQRVGAGLLPTGPGPIAQPGEGPVVIVSVVAGVDGGLVDQHRALHVGRQRVRVSGALADHRAGEVVDGADRDRPAVLQQVRPARRGARGGSSSGTWVIGCRRLSSLLRRVRSSRAFFQAWTRGGTGSAGVVPARGARGSGVGSG